MRLHIIFFVFFLMGCVMEERQTDVYSIEYDCEQPSSVMFFTLNSESSSQRFLSTTTLELQPDLTPRYNENYLSIEGDSVFVRTYINLNNDVMRLDLLFYREGTGNCSGIKGDAVVVKGYFDEGNNWRNRFYPIDCASYTELMLTQYNPEENHVCGRFAFTVRVQNLTYTISNGYFNLKLSQ